MKDKITMLAVSDIILDTPKPAEPFFNLVRPTLTEADVTVGQCEVYYTSRGVATFADPRYPATPSPISSIDALKTGGIDVVSMASNHSWDAGIPGVEDTINGLDRLGILHTGAGMNIDEAHKPCIIEKEGTKIGFLSYNCVGPVSSWATKVKPGCAYVEIKTVYEANFAGCPPKVLSYPEPETMDWMIRDIKELRPKVDILVVSLHKGIGFTPTKLGMYEHTLSYAAIDAGADLILGHHAHILKGIEIYKGKYIFHGMGHFLKVLDHGMGKDMNPADAKKFMMNFVEDHGGPFCFGPDGTMIEFPPRDEHGVELSDMTIIAKFEIKNKQIDRVSYLPVLIRKDEQPEILTRDSEYGQKVYKFIKNSTDNIDLNAAFEWDGDEVVVTEKSN